MKIDYRDGPRSGQQETFGDLPTSIGAADAEGVYQRTERMEGDRFVYEWRPITHEESNQILKDAEPGSPCGAA